MADEYEDLGPLAERFKAHPLTPDGAVLINTMREEHLGAAITIHRYVPESREKALALTKLEEALMWANKAVALHVKETRRGQAQ